MSSKNANQKKFSTLQFLWGFENCLIFAFMLLYLTDNGFSNYHAGMLIAIIAALGMIVQPFLGFLCDTKYAPKKIILVSCAGIIFTSGFLPLTQNSTILLSANILLLSLFCYSQGSIIDCWIVSASNQMKHTDYSFARSFGSAGYSIGAILIGKTISALGYEFVFGMHFIVVILIVLTTFSCPNIDKDVSNHSITNVGFYATIKDMLLNKPFLLFCISVCLFQIALRATGTYMINFLKFMGGNETHLGISIFLSAVFEIPSLFFCSHFRKNKHILLKVFALSNIILFIRLFQLILFPSVFITLLMQVPQAIATGLYIGTFVQYLNIILEHRQLKTGIAVGYTITTGLGGCLGIYIGGFLMEKVGIMNYVLIADLLLVAGFVIALLLIYPLNRNKKDTVMFKGNRGTSSKPF